MAINVKSENGQIALNFINEKEDRRKWIIVNRRDIRAAYERLGFPRPDEQKILEMARQDTGAFAQALDVLEAEQWVIELDGYRKGGFNPKYKKGNMPSKIAASLAFVDTLKERFGTLGKYTEHLDARRRVDELPKNVVEAYGYNALVRGYRGDKDFIKIKERAEFFQELVPVMQQQFGRDPTQNDVTRIMRERGTVGKFESFLEAGVEAGEAISTIQREDLGQFGVGGLTQAGLQQDIFASKDIDLQARIEEARLRRKRAVATAESQAATQTAGGLRQEDLF